jgi:hypothetical protein
MAILNFANRLVDFDFGLNMVINVTNNFDAMYVANCVQCVDLEDFVGMDVPAGTTTTWFHFRTEQTGTTANATGTYTFLEIFDGVTASGTMLARIIKGSGTSTNFNVEVFGATTVAGPTFVPGTLNTWDLSVTVSGTTTTVALYINGSIISTTSNTANGGLGTARSIRVYPKIHRRVGGAAGVGISEFMVSDTSTVGQRLACMAIVANGDLVGMAGTVTDMNTSGDGLGLLTDAPGERHTWTHVAYGGAVKNLAAVMLSGRASRNAGTPTRIANALRISSVNYDGDDKVIPIATPTAFKQVWATNPATAGVWTSAQLSGVQGGLKSTA